MKRINTNLAAVIGTMLLVAVPFTVLADQAYYTVSNQTGLVIVSGGTIPTVQAFCTAGGSNVGAVVMDAPNFVNSYAAAFGDSGAYFSADSGCATHDFTGPYISAGGLWQGALPQGGATFTVINAQNSGTDLVSSFGAYLSAFLPQVLGVFAGLIALGTAIHYIRKYVAGRKV